MIKWEGLLALNAWVALAFIIVWNLVMGLALFLNGGIGPIINAASGYVISFALFGASVFALAIVFNQKFRNILIKETRREMFSKSPFVFASLLFFGLGIMSTIEATNAF